MSDVLARCCDTPGCKTPPILGTEAITLREPYYPEQLTSHAHAVIEYGLGLVQDLNAAALAAGWKWDGQNWKCGPCANPGSVIELASLYAELADPYSMNA